MKKFLLLLLIIGCTTTNKHTTKRVKHDKFNKGDYKKSKVYGW